VVILLGVPGLALAQVPQGSPLPRIAPLPPPPTASPMVQPPLQPSPALPAATVAIGAVVIDGATAYPPARLAALTNALVGPHTSLREIEAARLGILRLYRDDGYPFVVVSARADKSGLLHFSVVEGYIAEIKLSADIGPVGALVLRFLNHLTEQRPVNNSGIEYWLLLAQKIPGLQIQPVLQALAREPGAFTLIAKVSRSTVSGSFAADNRAYPLAGHEEGLLAVGINSQTSLGERSEASLYVAGPNGRQIFGQASEEFFVGGAGLSVRLYGGAGDTQPCCTLHAIGYDGRTTVFGAQLAYPLVLSRAQQLYLRGDFDALDSQTLQEGETASTDNLRMLRAEADYSLSDILLGSAFAGDTTAVLRVSHGLSILGASPNGRADAGRLNENTGFTKVDAEVTRDQTLLSLADGTRLSLFGLAAGQATGDILPTEEEFYLGGLRYTRGFYSGEVTGDKALALTAELRVSTDVVVELGGRTFDIAPQYYGFYDWGATWQNQITDANQTLRSYGLGVRAGVTQNVRLELEGLRRETRQIGGASQKPLPAEAVYWRVVTFF